MKRFKCLVKDCGHVVRTVTGIGMHIKGRHPGVKVTRGKTFDKTRDALTNPKRNGPYKAKTKIKVKARKRKVVIQEVLVTPETKFIDVPCMLRVSIDSFKVHGDLVSRAAC